MLFKDGAHWVELLSGAQEDVTFRMIDFSARTTFLSVAFFLFLFLEYTFIFPCWLFVKHCAGSLSTCSLFHSHNTGRLEGDELQRALLKVQSGVRLPLRCSARMF